MNYTKAKSANQRQPREFKVIVDTDAEVAFSDGKETLIAFDATAYDGKAYSREYQVFIDLDLFTKRAELFRAGHRLVIVAKTDDRSPVLYATGAWFDRDRPRH